MSLFQCVKDNDVEALKALITGGTDVNAVDEYGRTALWLAATWGTVRCATALIDAKADVDKADEDGYTPLHMASSTGHPECVRVGCLWGRAVVGACM